MRPLELSLKSDPGQRLNLSCLTPDKLAARSELEIAKLAIGTTKKPVTLGDAFNITAGDKSEILFTGLTNKCDYVGDKMQSGAIKVEGDAGPYAGARMRGGKLQITGNAADYAGASMKDGTIVIGGNAGKYAGGRYHTENQGMRGGVLHIRGNSSCYTAERMRRGLLIIDGTVGNFAASGMIAGTVIIAGNHGKFPGYGMRRGTLFLNSSTHMLPTFADCGVNDLPILNMMRKHLQNLNAAGAITSSRVRRFAGDMASLGRGEILVPQP